MGFYQAASSYALLLSLASIKLKLNNHFSVKSHFALIAIAIQQVIEMCEGSVYTLAAQSRPGTSSAVFR